MKFFVLGAHPEISCAEIEAVTKAKIVGRPNPSVVLVDIMTPSVELQERLAGVIKVGTVMGSLKGFDKQKMADLIRSQIKQRDGKVQFGISTYDQRLAKEMQPLGLEVKKRLKVDGVSCRLVTSRESALSSVVVAKNHLLQKGGELVIIQNGHETLIGKTEAVQDFAGWGRRDFGRPARNAKSGMLPPKLARLMLNLTGVEPKKSSVLDPFCGSGTVLMEAQLLGFKKIYGSDLSAQAMADTKMNLDWMKGGNGAKRADRYPFRAQFVSLYEHEKGVGELPIALYKNDAATLTLKQPVDAVVTEPFLGRPQKGGETAQQLEAIRHGLLELYERAFSHLVTLVKPGGVLVVSFPIIGEVPVIPKIKSVQALGAPLSYRREGQHIGRLIVRWKKI